MDRYNSINGEQPIGLFIPPIGGFYTFSIVDGYWCSKDKYDHDTAELQKQLESARGENDRLRGALAKCNEYACELELAEDQCRNPNVSIGDIACEAQNALQPRSEK